MSPNRGAAIQAIVSQEERKRPIFDIMSENARRDWDNMVMRDLFAILDGVSKWELGEQPIHVPCVYQIDTTAFESSNFLPGRWSKNVN